MNAPQILKLAAISLTSSSDKAENLTRAFRLIKQAASKGADWILLPEIFAYHGDYSEIFSAAEEEDGPLNHTLSKLAKELGVVLFAGTVGERPRKTEALADELRLNSMGQKRVFNTSYVFGRDGAMLLKYRKTHLFNLRSHQGDPLYCEPEGFIPGSELVGGMIDGLRVGMAICYDLRFAGFFQNLNQKFGPLDVMVIPSAFTQKTGEAHWELLLRARAVELQSYVFASNQCGTHRPGKSSYGHSMIIDPWGIKLADSGDQEGFCLAELDRNRIGEIRAQLPVLSNQRPELY